MSGGSLRWLDVARMVREEPPAVPWVIKPLIVKGCLTMIDGREGEGKSLLAMSLGAGVATGHDEAGMSCTQGRVLVVDAENGSHEIHRRVRTLDLPSEGIELFEAEGFDLRRNLGELERLLAGHRPDLLILDSFRSLWQGEENDSGEVAAVLDPLRNLIRRYEAGALLLHHSGKGTGTYRGSSAIGASVELGFRLAREDDDEDPDRRFLQCWKCRPAPEPLRRWLRLSLEAGRVFVDEAVSPEPQDPDKGGRPPKVREELRSKLTDALTPEGQRRADLARSVGREPKDRSVGRVLNALRQVGIAEQDGELWRRVAKRQNPYPRGGFATPAATPSSEPCRCRFPASSPRADGDVCMTCRRPIGGTS
jgi:hypothetical protein